MPTFEYQAVNPVGASERGTVLSASLELAIETLSKRGLSVNHIQPAAALNDPLANFEVPSTPAPALAPAPAAQPAYQPPAEVPTNKAEEIAAYLAKEEAESPYAYKPYGGEQPQHEGMTAAAPPSAPPAEARPYIMTHVVGQVIGRADLKELAFFFRQFAAMEKAGVPMVSALQTLSKQQSSAYFAKSVMELSEHVNAGRPVSAGMQRYPEIFSPLAMSLVRAGEAGGFLPDAFKQVADYLDEEVELRQLYRKITFQPKLVLVSSVVLFALSNMVVGMFGHKGKLTTPLSNWGTWMVLGPLLIGLFLFFRIGLPNPAIRSVYDRYILKIPYLGNTLKQYCMAKFGRAFGALYAGGVPAPTSIKLAADACGNEYLRALMYPASKKMEDGASIAYTLAETGAFNPIVLDMLHTGEITGNINDMLVKMATFYEDEAKVRSQQLAQVTGVVMLAVAGIYVCYIALQFYGGYFGGMMDGAKDAGGMFMLP